MLIFLYTKEQYYMLLGGAEYFSSSEALTLV